MAPPHKKYKKNQSKGPYYFFMMEYRKKQEANGHVFRGGNHEVQLKASPIWNTMTPDEKEKYNEMARQHREWLRDNGEKYTSQGVPLSVVEAEQKAKVQKSDLVRNTISTMLDNGIANNELEKVEFYFISFNYFCVTSGGTYIPAEMGVVRYSLKDGVKDKLHMFIDPGKLPLGMAYDAKQHAESDHQLPIPPDAMGEKDNDEIILRLFSFLSNQEKLPPLFTDAPDIKMVENILKGILAQGAMDDNTLLVCPMAELFYQLKRSTESFGMDIKTFPSVHIAQAIIQKDVYEYTKDIACDYHEEQGNGKYCPLSKCIRWAFIISDSCCLDLSIEMKPGKHLPKNADTALCNTTNIGDTSTLLSNQMDNCSFVSSSDVTHLTNPKMNKLPKSHYDAFDDKGSKLFSSSHGLKAGSSSSGYRSSYDSGRPRIKDDPDGKYDSYSSASSSRYESRESRSAWGSSSYRGSPPPSSRTSYDSRDRRDREAYRDSYSKERERDSYRDRRDSYGRRGRDSPDYSIGGNRIKTERRSPDSDRGESSRSSRTRRGSDDDYPPIRVKEERRSPSPDSRRSHRRSPPSRSGDSTSAVSGYGRGSLYKPPASPPGSSPFSASDFPELGAVRSAGRGQLSK